MKKCPFCDIPLLAVEYEGFPILRCEQCRGHLVRSSRLDAIKRVARKSKDELKAEATAEFHSDNSGPIKCPRCHMTMHKRSIALPLLALQMDVCIPCTLVWLDGGELALAQLGYETSARFLDAQELKRRMASLDASPDRKAAFEKNVAQLPAPTYPVESALEEVAAEVVGALLRSSARRYGA